VAVNKRIQVNGVCERNELFKWVFLKVALLVIKETNDAFFLVNTADILCDDNGNYGVAKGISHVTGYDATSWSPKKGGISAIFDVTFRKNRVDTVANQDHTKKVSLTDYSYT
jgi:hypothetical protein